MCDLSLGEFLELAKPIVQSWIAEEKPAHFKDEDEVWEYGMSAIQRLLNCSYTTAHRMKNSGLLDEAIVQSGRKIMVNVKKAKEILKAQKK